MSQSLTRGPLASKWLWWDSDLVFWTPKLVLSCTNKNIEEHICCFPSYIISLYIDDSIGLHQTQDRHLNYKSNSFFLHLYGHENVQLIHRISTSLDNSCIKYQVSLNIFDMTSEFHNNVKLSKIVPTIP